MDDLPNFTISVFPRCKIIMGCAKNEIVDRKHDRKCMIFSTTKIFETKTNLWESMLLIVKFGNCAFSGTPFRYYF